MADEIRIKHTAGLGTLIALGWVGASRISGSALVNPNTISASNWGTTGAVTLTEKQTSDAQGVGLYVGNSAYVADGLQEWYAFEGTPTPTTDDVSRVGFFLLDGVRFESAVDALIALVRAENLDITSVRSACNLSLQDAQLDHLIFSADPGGIVADSSLWAKLHSKSATPSFASYNNQTDSLEAQRDATLDLTGTPIDGKSVVSALRIISAGVAGKVSGAGTGTEVFVGLDGSTTIHTVTATPAGNRTNVVYAI